MRLWNGWKTVGLATGCCIALHLMSSLCLAKDGDSPWMMRVRALGIIPDDSSSTITTIGGKAEVDSALTLDVDFAYFFTDNIAAELTLTYSRHDVTAKGTAVGNLDLGSVDILPPTLTLQYHFLPKNAFRPYIGAGVSYVLTPNEDPGVANAVNYENGVFGPAIQFGFDYFFTKNWCINFDVKKVWVDVDVDVHAFNQVVHTNVDVDPWLIGVGIGYRF